MKKTRGGEMILAARTEKGWSLYDLSGRTGLLPQTISAIENGDSQHPREANLRTLSEVLGITFPDLVLAFFDQATPVTT